MKRMEASYTVEAALIMGLVLWTLGFLIQSAYQLHDTVTGAMILQETVEIARHNQDEKFKISDFAKQGQKLGEPRLWLREFQIIISEGHEKVEGKARAGKWRLELSMEKKRPEQFLRKYQAFFEKWGDEDAGGR